MSSITKPISIVSSLPSLFTTCSKSPSLLSFPSKPINLFLSSSTSLKLKLKSKTHFSSLLAFVDGQDQQVLVEQGEEEPKWENDETDAAEASWGPEGEGEDAVFEQQSGDSEEEVPEPSEEAKLFVGNLPFDVDSQSLAMLFEKAGTVEIAEVIYNRDTQRSRGFGFVTMSSVEEAEKGAELFNGYDLNGRLLTVNKSAPRGSRVERPPRVYEPSFRVYVGNLPWDVDNGRLEQIFSEHGKVVDARVVYDRESGRSRGFGFVTMSSETELNDAIAALDGQSLDGRALRVNVAKERPRRGGFF